MEMGARAIFEIDAEYYVLQEDYDELEEENKELKSELDYVRTIKESAEERIKELEEENKKLKEEIRFLEQCLDNKEKVNKKLREELSAYDREYFDEDKKAKNIFIDKNGKVVSGGEFRELC